MALPDAKDTQACCMTCECAPLSPHAPALAHVLRGGMQVSASIAVRRTRPASMAPGPKRTAPQASPASASMRSFGSAQRQKLQQQGHQSPQSQLAAEGYSLMSGDSLLQAATTPTLAGGSEASPKADAEPVPAQPSAECLHLVVCGQGGCSVQAAVC